MLKQFAFKKKKAKTMHVFDFVNIFLLVSLLSWSRLSEMHEVNRYDWCELSSYKFPYIGEQNVSSVMVPLPLSRLLVEAFRLLCGGGGRKRMQGEMHLKIRSFAHIYVHFYF